VPQDEEGLQCTAAGAEAKLCVRRYVVLVALVLNHRAHQVGTQSVNGAAQRHHPVISWICHWALLVNWSQLGLFPRSRDVRFRDEQLEHCGNVRGQYINILPPPAFLCGHLF